MKNRKITALVIFLTLFLGSCKKQGNDKNMTEYQASQIILSTLITDDGGIINELFEAVELISYQTGGLTYECGDFFIYTIKNTQSIGIRQFDYTSQMITTVSCFESQSPEKIEVYILKEGPFVGPDLARDGETEAVFNCDAPSSSSINFTGSYRFLGNVDLSNKKGSSKIDVDARFIFDYLSINSSQNYIRTAVGTCSISGWLYHDAVVYYGTFEIFSTGEIVLTFDKDEYHFML